MRIHVTMNWTHYLAVLVVLISITTSTGCGKSMKDLAFFGSNPYEKSTAATSSIEDFDAQPTSLTIWHDSYEAALKESKETGKPILADFTGSDWCHWCVKLKDDVFSEKQFEAWARENVVLLELDYPKRGTQPPAIKKQNAELAKRYSISGYPTVLLLDSDGSSLGKLGYMDNPKDWIESADRIMNTSMVASKAAPTGNETR